MILEISERLGWSADELLNRMSAAELDERIALERLRQSEHTAADKHHAKLVFELNKLLGRGSGMVRLDDYLPYVNELKSHDPRKVTAIKQRNAAAVAAWQALAKRPSE